jgi:hypothetical protein
MLQAKKFQLFIPRLEHLCPKTSSSYPLLIALYCLSDGSKNLCIEPIGPI